MKILLLDYNNYYNKLVKTDDLDTYIDRALYITPAITNFNPHNGITTEHIFNYGAPLATPDYCVVVDDTMTNLISRWFVVDWTRTRGGQYNASLRRDLMADNLEAIMNATCFVERGWCSDNSPLIYNSEGVNFNQIKQGEIILSNRMNTPWLVAYLARYDGENKGMTYQGHFRDTAETKYDEEYTTLSQYPYYGIANNDYTAYNSPEYRVEFLWKKSVTSAFLSKYKLIVRNGQSDDRFAENWTQISGVRYPELVGVINTFTSDWQAMTNTLTAQTTTQNNLPFNTTLGVGTEDGITTLLAENGKRLKVGNKFYRVRVFEISNSTNIEKKLPISDPMWTAIRDNLASWYGWGDEQPQVDGVPFAIGYNTRTIGLSIDEYGGDGDYYGYDFGYRGGAITKDAVYEILACPYTDYGFELGGTSFTHSGKLAQQWLLDMAAKGTDRVYDVQLVPYCPIDIDPFSGVAIDQYNIVELNKGTVDDQDQFTPSSTIGAVGFRLDRATFSDILDFSYHPDSLWLEDRAYDRKRSVNCDLYRLVSPNGTKTYEFSMAKNGGATTYEIYCTLMPQTPYIKINPVFGNLYGNGARFRGLVCGGDYSLARVANQWEQYQLQNKYYQDIFDRQIDSQEMQNAVTARSERWAIAAGAISGVTSGAIGGTSIGMMAGPIGAGIGAGIGTVAGGAVSLAAGITDYEANQALRAEQLSLSKYLFDYNLRTIQAQPNTLTRSTAINIENAYFPYLEYYTCTDEETNAFNRYISFRGYNIGVVGTLSNFINPTRIQPIKATIINIDIDDDAHVVNEINALLSGGIRINAQ